MFSGTTKVKLSYVKGPRASNARRFHRLDATCINSCCFLWSLRMHQSHIFHYADLHCKPQPHHQTTRLKTCKMQLALSTRLMNISCISDHTGQSWPWVFTTHHAQSKIAVLIWASPSIQIGLKLIAFRMKYFLPSIHHIHGHKLYFISFETFDGLVVVISWILDIASLSVTAYCLSLLIWCGPCGMHWMTEWCCMVYESYPYIEVVWDYKVVNIFRLL